MTIEKLEQAKRDFLEKVKLTARDNLKELSEKLDAQMRVAKVSNKHLGLNQAPLAEPVVFDRVKSVDLG